ncbi:hypothetical protein AB0J01_28185 [Streptomyces sp. NPDC050204]|uniref:hypothetical protein n=1 Tax=Streptomyces sp. NPDC050204 TaxID=3155514 RepID=UPI00343DDB74
MRHLFSCPGCREADRPPLRSRTARMAPTLALLLRHPHPHGTHLCPGRWTGTGPTGEDVLRQLSAGHLHAAAVCGFARHGTTWDVCVTPERFTVLDRARIAAGIRLSGQPLRPGGYRWLPENTPADWHTATTHDAEAAGHPQLPPATVVIPGTTGRHLQQEWSALLEDAAHSTRWSRRGRSSALQVTTDTVGLVALDTLLASPHTTSQGPTAAEQRARLLTRERLVAALAAQRQGARVRPDNGPRGITPTDQVR